MKRAALTIAVIGLMAIRVHGQEIRPGPDGFSIRDGWPAKKVVATGLVGLTILATGVDFYYSWWKDAERPFSFYTDNWFNGSQRGLDKLGHFIGPHVHFKSIQNLMRWGGYEPSTALWWAAGLAAFNAVEIEIGDGFTQYGFDYQDLLFGLAGVSYGVLQTEVPAFQNLTFKFSYYSNTGFSSPASFIQDYDAMTVWASVNVHNLLPDPLRKYWPSFINLAFGFGTTEWTTRREFILGLDLNLEGVNTGNEEILFAQKMLNLMHIPGPAFVWTEHEPPRSEWFYVR